MAEDWSIEEVEATVAEYFAMLKQQLQGEPYSKTEHRRRIEPLLNQRSRPAIEYKFRNVSAVLQDLHHPWIIGYKPAKNYQQLLAEAVVSRIEAERSIQALVLQSVEEQVDGPPSRLQAFEDPPSGVIHSLYVREARPLDEWLRRARVIDYFAREARNRSLGAAGERAIVEMERARLTKEGRQKLADKVERVSESVGDGAGFDVLSFETDGRERFIEVKTTAFAKETPLHVTRSERDFSYDFSAQYQLYRLFTFREQPRVYSLKGALEKTTILEATAFIATPSSIR